MEFDRRSYRSCARDVRRQERSLRSVATEPHRLPAHHALGHWRLAVTGK